MEGTVFDKQPYGLVAPAMLSEIHHLIFKTPAGSTKSAASQSAKASSLPRRIVATLVQHRLQIELRPSNR
jgi:hypothetical protein